jgi:hypothetical protein
VVLDGEGCYWMNDEWRISLLKRIFQPQLATLQEEEKQRSA